MLVIDTDFRERSRRLAAMGLDSVSDCSRPFASVTDDTDQTSLTTESANLAAPSRHGLAAGGDATAGLCGSTVMTGPHSGAVSSAGGMSVAGKLGGASSVGMLSSDDPADAGAGGGDASGGSARISKRFIGVACGVSDVDALPLSARLSGEMPRSGSVDGVAGDSCGSAIGDLGASLKAMESGGGGICLGLSTSLFFAAEWCVCVRVTDGKICETNFRVGS
jgi:hypothetical protein